MKNGKKPEDFVKKAEYASSKQDIDAFLREHLRYPEEARRKGTCGRVMVAFSVDQNGRVNHARVIKGIGDGCDEEALRLVRLLEFHPVKNRRMRTTTNRRMSIRFELPETRQISLQYQFQPDHDEAVKPIAGVSSSEPPPEQTPPASNDTGMPKTFSYTVSVPEKR